MLILLYCNSKRRRTDTEDHTSLDTDDAQSQISDTSASALSRCEGSSDSRDGDMDAALHSSALVSPTPSPPPFSIPLPPEAGDSGSMASAAEPEVTNLDVCDDIGLALRSMSQSQIRNLPPERKYSLLINHFRPNSNYKFPSRFLGGCNRACQHRYLVDNPWFVYSKVEDGIFCLPCVLFATIEDLGQFVCEKFNNWVKKSEKFASHNTKHYHQLALTRVDALKSTMAETGRSIGSCLRQISSENIVRNRFVVKSIADTILVCGQQCIALRGHRDDGSESADTLSNRGNFRAILNYGVRSGNKVLGDHLKTAPKNAVYTSKTIQNDLIDCIGGYIRDKIIHAVKEAKWYSILCDEVVDVAGKQQVSIVLRFVDDKDIIREELVDFFNVDRITGEVLASKIRETLVKYNLNLSDCRGQGYDGATNMSGASGVQGRLKADNPKAIYVHCNSHVLNLCIVQACSLPSIRNMNLAVTETHYFFDNSFKRQIFFEKIIDKETKVVKVKDLCRTRWIYRHEAYETFYVLYKYLVATMKAITTNDLTFGKMDWDGKTVVAANGLLSMYKSFSFILSFVVTMNIMAIIKSLSIKLQCRTNDIVYAYNKVTVVVDELTAIRVNDQIIHTWYVQSETVAAEVDVIPVVPRTTGRQCHRDNPEHATAEEYYRRAITLPLLDNVIQQMKERFSKTQILASKFFHLVPSIVSDTAVADIDGLISFYDEDMPTSFLMSSEILRWKDKWERQGAADRPTSLQAALKACDRDFFPNLYTLLRLGCTLPVTSCENERANSTLKNLKTTLRSTMSEERLSSLTLMHVHYDVPIDLNEIVDRFKLKCSRRILL